MNSIPTFAVIGHPNEGKSSVVSTLVEDDQIRISPMPGETVQSRTYPVTIDGRAVVAFVDTPGFQNPVQTLGWMRLDNGAPDKLLDRFLAHFGRDPGMSHECELMRPVAQGAGIIYVLDASRPMRQVDRAEMEILRLTGRPRMAILNCKTGEEGFLDEWKAELRKHFNMVRTFNAVGATFSERIRLLESLRAMEQDWEHALGRVVEAFVQDWKRRNAECAALACDFLRRVLTLTETAVLPDRAAAQDLEKMLVSRLEERIRVEESRLHEQVCRLFRHSHFAFVLPEQSVLRQDLFSRTTWTVFGLGRSKLVTAAAATGGAAGLALDLATASISMGVFAAAGSVTAGLAAFFQGDRLARSRVLGKEVGQRLVEVGPLGTVQWIYILLDRFLLHYWYVANWSHARRTTDLLPVDAGDGGKQGLTDAWPRQARGLCAEYFRALSGGKSADSLQLEVSMRRLLEDELERISSL